MINEQTIVKFCVGGVTVILYPGISYYGLSLVCDFYVQ